MSVIVDLFRPKKQKVPDLPKPKAAKDIATDPDELSRLAQRAGVASTLLAGNEEDLEKKKKLGNA